MRRSTAALVAAVLLLAGTIAHVRAALDNAVATDVSELQLLVLEVENCYTCDLVRRHIEPAYARGPQSRDAPLRYIDLNAVDEASLGLRQPVTIVPTIVLMRDGHEVARLAGYVGPTNFFAAVEHMLARAQ